MSFDHSILEIEAQLRQKIAAHLCELGYDFKTTSRRYANRYYADEDLMAAILKSYVIRKRPADPMKVYRNVLDGIYPLRTLTPKSGETEEIVPAAQRKALIDLQPYSYSPAMKFYIDRARQAQPRLSAMASNLPPNSLIAEQVRKGTPQESDIEPSDADRRNWGIA